MPADANDLLRRFRQQPFEPFRLVMGDGEAHEFQNPDMVLVTAQELVVGVPDQSQPALAGSFRYIPLVDVDRVEPLSPVGK